MTSQANAHQAPTGRPNPSPGQRPGLQATNREALKGRSKTSPRSQTPFGNAIVSATLLLSAFPSSPTSSARHTSVLCKIFPCLFPRSQTPPSG
jgi:hypothetical protein